MKQTIINKLSVFSNENPTLLGSIATNKQIENAQKILRVTMNEDYKEFILNFGGSYAGMAKWYGKNHPFTLQNPLFCIAKQACSQYADTQMVIQTHSGRKMFTC